MGTIHGVQSRFNLPKGLNVKFLVKALFPACNSLIDRVAETSENWFMSETSENWSMGEFNRTNFNWRSNTNTYNYPFVIIHSIFYNCMFVILNSWSAQYGVTTLLSLLAWPNDSREEYSNIKVITKGRMDHLLPFVFLFLVQYLNLFNIYDYCVLLFL